MARQPMLCVGRHLPLTAYLTPYATLVHQGKGTSTQDKHRISWAAWQNYAAAAATAL